MSGTRFTASNGWYIEDGSLRNPVGSRWGQVDPVVDSFIAEALFEYGAHKAQTERDAALGRWRSAERPDYVAYDHGDGRVRFLRELDGVSYSFARDSMSIRYPAGCAEFPFSAVAREYFAAHPVPEPKPWEQATPGEVWVLTFPDGTSEAYKVYPGGTLITCWESNRLKSLTRDGIDAIAGRRIWPEVSA